MLVLLMHGTTLASALRELRPDLSFTFFTTEHFFFRTLRAFHAEALESSKSVNIVCEADLPNQVFDEVIFATLSGDSSELAQDLIQAAHQRLRALLQRGARFGERQVRHDLQGRRAEA